MKYIVKKFLDSNEWKIFLIINNINIMIRRLELEIKIKFNWYF